MENTSLFRLGQPADLRRAGIMRRCETVVRYCLGHGGMDQVQKSLGTLRFMKVSFVSMLWSNRMDDD
jgi:hypothetical protein